MAESEVLVLCYWNNGCIKHGPGGVYFEGSTPKEMRVKQETKFSRFLDGLYLMTGLDKQTSKFEIFGRYPSVVSQSMVKYLLFPVMCDDNLERMLEIPSKHPSINTVDLYLKVKPTSSGDVIVPPAAFSRPMENPGGPSKRQKRTQQEVCSLTKVVNSGVSEPRLVSSLWLEDDTMRVGLCFKDRDELKKAVDWWSIKRQRKCLVRETKKDTYRSECVRWKCKWSICAARMENHGGCFEITKYTGPHTCRRGGYPEAFEEDFLAYEIERAVRVQPTISVAELKVWWKKRFGYELTDFDEVDDAEGLLQEAKEKAIKRLFGDWDQSFRFMPKLMSALHSSNGMIVDWQYDSLPNPEHASFRGVFWAFSQSVEGFQYCRPLIIVDTKHLKGKYNMELMIASGFDAANKTFPLAFAVTKEVSIDSWRWFLTRIREKVTQRKGLCLISRHHPDILAVINEPGSQWREPWAYHRFCLSHLCSQFSRLFPDSHRTEFLVRHAGSSIQKEEFDSYMKNIKEKNPEAWKWLNQIPPHQWALAHDGGQRYGIMEIDTESLDDEGVFAACRSFQKVAMTGGVMLLFGELRDAFDESFSSSRAFLNRGDVYTEPVMDKLQEFVTDSGTYVITPLERDAFQVSEPSKKNEHILLGKCKEKMECIVQLNDSTCTCGEFQRKKFPCMHALAVCKKMKINPLQYVDDCYSVERYYKTYAATFSPVPELSAWPEASGVPSLFPPVIARPPLKVSGKGKDRRTKEPPSDEELRKAIFDILKAMDFKMDSLTDIHMQLADKFEIDLTPRKSYIEVMIQYELEKNAADETEEEDEDEEEEGEEEEEEEEEY